MIFYSQKRAERLIEQAVAVREQKEISYSEDWGYEGSNNAFMLAQMFVYKSVLDLGVPAWAFKGDEKFRKYALKFNQKVPSYDFDFIIEYTEVFWDTFRFTLMQSENVGKLSPEVLGEMKTRFVELFNQMPSKFRVKDRKEEAAADLMIHSLAHCLRNEKQLVANAIFEYVLLVWYHYTWNYR